ncbi:polymeric immunoglobulin receptor-like [Clarias gariepinus]
MITLFVALYSLLCLCTTVNTSDIKELHVKTVKPGEAVTMECNIKSRRNFAWYRQSFGKVPQVFARQYGSTQGYIFAEGFNDNRFSVTVKDQKFDLNINEIREDDGGEYFCGYVEGSTVKFTSGTRLQFEGKTSNIKNLHAKTVKRGEAVTMECNISEVRSKYAIAWYRQSFGKVPQFLVRPYSRTLGYTFVEGFTDSRFSVTVKDQKFDLNINEIREDDGGEYFCGYVDGNILKFTSGTRLQFEGEEMKPCPTPGTLNKNTHSVTHQGSNSRDGEGKTSDIKELQVKMVKHGEFVTMECNISRDRHRNNLFWYRQSFGKVPQFLVRQYSRTQGYTFAEGFNDRRFSVTVKDQKFNLNINEIREDDGGEYFCGYVEGSTVKFTSGTRLQFEGEEMKPCPTPGTLNKNTHSVTHQGSNSSDGEGQTSDIKDFYIKTVKPGESVTMECNNTEVKNKNSLAWYRQSFGKVPQVFARPYPGTPGYIFAEGFNDNRFSVTVKDQKFDLNINEIREDDGGEYFCGYVEGSAVKFTSGTRLQFEGKTSNIKNLHAKTVKRGETVTMECNISEVRSKYAIAWYRQSFGKVPQFLVRPYSRTLGYTFVEGFTDSRFSVTVKDQKFDLNINEIREDDGGEYFCGYVEGSTVKFTSGTRLQFEGEEMKPCPTPGTLNKNTHSVTHQGSNSRDGEGEETLELHSVDLEMEAVEKLIRDLQVKLARLQQRKATLESSRTDAHLSQVNSRHENSPTTSTPRASLPRSNALRTQPAQLSFTPAPGYHEAWKLQQRKTRAKPRARTSPPPPPPVFEISTRNRFAPLRETAHDALVIGDSIVRHVRATTAKGKAYTRCLPGARVLDVAAQVPAALRKNIRAVVLHAGTNDIRLRGERVEMAAGRSRAWLKVNHQVERATRQDMGGTSLAEHLSQVSVSRGNGIGVDVGSLGLPRACPS